MSEDSLPVIGVIGAGTMGSGIAQLGAQAGARTLVFDPSPEALEQGIAKARKRLDDDAGARLEAVDSIAALQRCGLVVEAAPENLELKREIVGELAQHVAEDCVIATNTSSLLVAAVATAVEHPERVVGMHFFNPPPVMKLLEVVAHADSSDAAVATARAVGEAMGRHVIVAKDSIGFVVNRCNRPFALEGLRCVQEGLASHEQVDRIVRMAGGYRMGPFELMDLVGVDTGLDISKSFYEQSFGEPRWRPSPLVAGLVAAGRFGRKSGRGWYEYPDGRPEDPEPPERGGGDGLVVVAGDTATAAELAQAAEEAGWEVAAPEEAEGRVPFLIVDCGSGEEDPPLEGGPQLILCDVAPLAALDPEGTAAGFHVLPPLGRLAELTTQPTTSKASTEAATRFLGSLGMHVEHVGDAPGLVLGRIVAQLVNEACFALAEGVASPADVDAGMELGVNHPRGPLTWADEVGADVVLTILAGLQEEYQEDRYRPAPHLVRAVRLGLPLRPEE